MFAFASEKWVSSGTFEGWRTKSYWQNNCLQWSWVGQEHPEQEQNMTLCQWWTCVFFYWPYCISNFVIWGNNAKHHAMLLPILVLLLYLNDGVETKTMAFSKHQYNSHQRTKHQMYMAGCSEKWGTVSHWYSSDWCSQKWRVEVGDSKWAQQTQGSLLG